VSTRSAPIHERLHPPTAGAGYTKGEVMAKAYQIDLTDGERAYLRALLQADTTAARTATRAHVLLLADEGQADMDIAATLHLTVGTVERIRKKFRAGGVAGALAVRSRR